MESLEQRHLLTTLFVNATESGPDKLTLADAVTLANQMPGHDIIEFDLDDAESTPVIASSLEIRDSLTIRGPGPDRLSIDANGSHTAFYIGAGVDQFVLEGVTMTGGQLKRGDIPESDQAALVDARGGGELIIRNARFADNEQLQLVYAEGTTTLEHVAFVHSDNTHRWNSSGVNAVLYLDGPATIRDSSLEVENCGSCYRLIEFTGALTVERSAIHIDDGYAAIQGGQGTSLEVRGSTLRGSVSGGEILISSSTTQTVVGANVTMVDSTVTGGRAGGVSGTESVTLVGSTVAHNTTNFSSGNRAGVQGGVVHISHSTIVNNGPDELVELPLPVGGVTAFKSLTIENSIIAHNQGGIFHDIDVSQLPTPAIIRNTLIGDTSSTGLMETATGQFDGNGNLFGGPIHGSIDPRLGNLRDNGGPTHTYALLPGSPALDAGDVDFRASEQPQFDQRGQAFRRLANGRIDMGAYERQALVATISAGTTPITLPPDVVEITFSMPVTGFELDDLALYRNGGDENLLTEQQRLHSLDGRKFHLSGLTSVTAEPGYYELHLPNQTTEIVARSDGSALDQSISGGWATGRSSPRIVVDTLTDEADGRIDDGDISLRDAIASVGAGETIEFASALSGQTLSLAHGPLSISRPLVIDATSLDQPLTITAPTQPWSRKDPPVTQILHIQDDHVEQFAVTLRGLHFDGNAQHAVPYAPQSSVPIIYSTEHLALQQVRITNGALGVFNAGTLDVTGSRLDQNRSAAIFSAGPLTVNAATIEGNQHGGIIAQSSVHVADSRLVDNHYLAYVTGGGGAVSSEGDILIERSTLQGNQATNVSPERGRHFGDGGAVNGRNVVVRDSLISHNQTLRQGGGLAAQNSLLIENSTISENYGQSDCGAAIAPTITVRSSTIVGNYAERHGGVCGEITLENSVVATNRGGADPDVFGSVHARGSFIGYLGHAVGEASELVETNSGDELGNLIGGPTLGPLNPLLGPLKDHGGGRPTHGPLPGSPLIDAGTTELWEETVSPSRATNSDQRGLGYSRVVGPAIDIGAHERQPLTATLRADSAGDLSSVVQAVEILFSQPVAELQLSHFQLQRNGLPIELPDGDPLQLKAIDGEGDSQRFRLEGLQKLATEAGWYELTLDSVEFSADQLPLDQSTAIGWSVGQTADAPLIVNTTVDELDGSITDGDVSLRDALAAASPGRIIQFDASLDGGTLFVSTELGPITLTRPVTVDASMLSSFAIDVTNAQLSRAIQVDDSNATNQIDVTLRAIDIRGGGKSDYEHRRGGILSHERLTVEGSKSYDLAGDSGAAIFATGTTIVRNSEFRRNTTFGLRAGGAILATGPLEIDSSTFAENHNEYYSDSDFGRGGSAISAGHLVMSRSTIYGNSSRWDSNTQTAVLAQRGEFEQTTVDDQPVEADVMVLSFSTFNGDTRAHESLTARNSIIRTLHGPSKLELDVRHTLIGLQATSKPLLPETAPGHPDERGNLVGGLLTHRGQQPSIDFRLGPLADNGGPTWTLMPKPDSPAVDGGQAGWPDSDAPREAGTDQRGNYPRLVGRRFDLGAVERGIAGDANGDGTVDMTDFRLLVGNFGKRDLGWSDGNFDSSEDGVNFVDFLLLAWNFS